MWRPDRSVHGPDRATGADVEPLNRLFTDAFTDRYARDGLSGVRVPPLTPAVWRYAIEDAAEGAMLWRDSDGQLAAFNMVHQSGTEGWMGPIAVRPDRQGSGVGRGIVQAGIELLRSRGATTIGLETMPRTTDNIGFYGTHRVRAAAPDDHARARRGARGRARCVTALQWRYPRRHRGVRRAHDACGARHQLQP